MKKLLVSFVAVALAAGLLAAPASADGHLPTFVEAIVERSGDAGFDDDGEDFDILREAVIAAGLVEAIDAVEDATLLAPFDRAFIRTAFNLGYRGSSDEAEVFAWYAEVLGVTADGPGLLDDVLLYHVTPGAKTRMDFWRADTIPTLLGPDIQTQGLRLIDANPDVPNPTVVRTFAAATTAGFIKTPNRVLLPVDTATLMAGPPADPGPVGDLGGASLSLVADLEGVDSPATVTGEFEAEGADVDQGLVCPSGTVDGTVTGPGEGWYDFVFTHELTCADGSGGFDLELQVRLLSPETHAFGSIFIWTVRSGTGAYEDLAGRGVGWAVDDPLATRDFFDVILGGVS